MKEIKNFLSKIKTEERGDTIAIYISNEDVKEYGAGDGTPDGKLGVGVKIVKGRKEADTTISALNSIADWIIKYKKI